MHRGNQDLGSLGYVRRQMPEKSNEGSRGRYAAAPVTRVAVPPQETRPRGAPAATPPTRSAAQPVGPQSEEPSAKTVGSLSGEPSAKTAAADSIMEELRALGKSCDDLSSTKARVDQISVKLSVLDNAVKATEKSVAALREEHGSLAKAAGGQTSERVDALMRQLKTLEDSFCDFSSRLERQCKELADGAERQTHAAASSTQLSDLDTGIAALGVRMRACEDASASQTGVLSAPAPTQEEVTASVVSWLRAEGLPDVKRSLAQADRTDVIQAASACAYEKLAERMEKEWAGRLACVQDTVHRCSLPVRGTVLRATNGKQPGVAVDLRHPIRTIGDTSFMHLVARGANGAVTTEMFAVEDETGPVVAFHD